MFAKRLLLSALVSGLLSACSGDAPEAPVTQPGLATEEDSALNTSANPFFAPSELEFQFPRFDLIRNEHYLPAFERGMQEQMVEIADITGQTAEPTFANTLVPLEISGQLLSRVLTVFYALSSAHTNDGIQQLEVEISPRLSAHRDSILLDPELFARVKAVYDTRASLGLDAESLRLVEETYKDFVMSGAQLDAQQKDRLKAINTELAGLETRFDQNVLAEVNASAVVVDSREELGGLSDAEIQAAADAAVARNLPGKYLLPLLNTSGQPLLTTLENRALRQRIMETSLMRGSRGNDYDNLEVLSRTVRLRAERAQLLGYPSHAALQLAKQTAQTVAAVQQRLADLIPPAVANAQREAAELQAQLQAEGVDFQLAAWDWAHYAEKVRQQTFNFDESQLRPYFELDNVLQKGVFFAANQIYGISFRERTDLPVYEDSVRVFEVLEADGSTLSFFLFDPYARPSKRGGAWMNDYVAQSALMGTQAIVANHQNIPKPPAGEPTLLTFDEVTTMFHEFGHALHGMFSNVTYPSFSGTNVPRDFVEYPSQVNEMWSTWPEVLKNYAVHYQSGEPMPADLLDKVLASQKFGQGFSTSEYLMAALIDMALHVLGPDEVPDAAQLLRFEADTLTAAGANLDMLPPRYRYPYFSHIMGGYSAGYYSYIWSEVLDADTVEWFKENGGMTRANGQHFRDTLLSRGGSAEALGLFRDFRGRDASVEPLLERRGLVDAVP
jgi:peptidyl-dipeptidase Dcp